MRFEYPPYVPVAQRRARAAREMAKRAKKGHAVSPVVIEGRTIARTFWGKAWCDNLEGYSDYANRLPRGRTYVRNGSVVDLQIAAGMVRAMVSGTALYQITVRITPLSKQRWNAICADSAGAIDSLVELLQGRFSKGVMERICQQKTGLFPSPKEITLACSCPDWASMCKHVAAVLYGIGARFDAQPELLFRLREVDEQELIARAGADVPLAHGGPTAEKVLRDDDLSALFGLEMADATRSKPARAKPRQKPAEAKPKPGRKAKQVKPNPNRASRPRGMRKQKPAPKKSRSVSH